MFDVWINKCDLKEFEFFIFGLELSQPQKIVVRFIDEPANVFQEYDTKLITIGNKNFYAF